MYPQFSQKTGPYNRLLILTQCCTPQIIITNYNRALTMDELTLQRYWQASAQAPDVSRKKPDFPRIRTVNFEHIP